MMKQRWIYTAVFTLWLGGIAVADEGATLELKLNQTMDEAAVEALQLPDDLETLLVSGKLESGKAYAAFFKDKLGGQNQERLETLHLNDVWSGDVGTKHLGSILEKLPNLTELVLEGNEIGDDGIIDHLAPNLHHVKDLQTLSLADNQLTEKSAKALFGALKALPDLQTVNLNNNKIGDEGAKKWANIIDEEKSVRDLKTIFLQHNSIGDHGAIALLAVFMKHKIDPSIINWGESENRFLRDVVIWGALAKNGSKELYERAKQDLKAAGQNLKAKWDFIKKLKEKSND